MKRIVLLTTLSTSTLLAACPNLAQLAFGEGLRDELIVECCECLATESTQNETATCSEAVIVDGVITIPADAIYGSETDNVSIPCLCEGDAASCKADLRSKTPILIPGACVDLLDQEAVCEAECAGVLSFSPVPGAT